MVDVRDLTGLILAGGLGSRMGGADKGLQHFQGMPLVLHARQRLGPQVAHLLVSANRHLDAYAAMGTPAWPDQRADFSGPLAGMLAGLAHCDTPYLVTVPCDSPFFPLDLVQRLSQAVGAADADVAVAATTMNGERRRQPVFCLMKATLMPSLREAVDSGHRKVDAWTALHRRVEVVFDDPAAFANVNTLQDLDRLQVPT